MAELSRLIVVCAKPGARVAGAVHPHLAEYSLGVFARAQLREMLAAPELRLFLGAPATAERLGIEPAPAPEGTPAKGRKPR